MSTTSNNLKSSATSLANAPRNNVATAIERELSSTMLMSNGTAKLSSLTPARDLSLGGRGGGGAANKKIFLPNLNVTRNKNKNVKTSKDTTISKSRGRGRTLDRSANGTSSGGRLGSSSLIQMTGVFSEGAGAANVRQPFGTSAYSKEIDDAPSVMRKPTLLKSEKKIDIKAVLAKDIDILKSLDDIDDHDDLEQKTDLDRMPVHLNEIKWKYTKTKVKSESMEYKADCGNSSEDAVEIASQIQALHVAQQSEQNNPIPRYPQTLKELFDKTQPQIFVMQLPDTLPCLKGDSDSQETSVSPATLTTDKLNNVTHKMKMVKDNEVKQMEEGHVGRLIRYKSGKTKLVLGKTYFDLDIGMETGFLQDLMSISCNRDERSGNMINLGPIRAKLTATPDWEQLLKQPLQRSCKYIAKLEVDQYNQSFRKLTNITNLSISDEEFIFNVNCDIENFLKQRHNNGVLLFPPVNNFRRFLIHQTCENFRNKYDLFTFSVGQGPLRRTVICFKNQLLDPHKYNDSVAAAYFESRHKNTTSAQLKSWRSDNRRIESASFSNTNSTGTTTNKRDRKMGVERNIIDTNKISKSNAGGLYRPPALRNHSNETLKIDVAEAKELTTKESSNCEIKAATSLLNSKADNNSIATTTSVSCNSSPIHKFENVNINNLATSTQQTSLYKNQQQQQQVEDKLQQPQRQQQTRRERRPDRAVYIPRARRSQTTPRNTATTQMQQPSPTQLPALVPKTTNDTSKSLNQQLAITLDDTTTASVNQKPSSKADEVGKINSCGVFNNNCDNNLTASTSIKKKEKLNKESKESREQRREQRLLRKLSVVSAQNIQNYKNNEHLNESSINIISTNYNGDEITKQIQSTSLINNVGNFSELSDNIINSSKGFDCDSSEETILTQERQPSDTTETCDSESLLENQINGCTEIVNTSIISDANSIINNSYINTMPKSSLKTKSTKLKSEELNQSKVPNLCIEDVALQQLPTKCDVEEQELQRASKEINRSNRRIIKQTFTSDVLLIPDHVNEEHEDKREVAEGINKLETNIASRTTRQIDSNTDDEDEDDWENMYNDSGDCLDPKIMQELTACVGKCKIELPKMDYSAYLTKQSILNEEEFPHVLEVSNFPVEFKNQDLLMVFSQYKESGFDIKWVDDTHALAVFSSSRIAAEVLTMGHPFVVLKPLAEATVESRLKAKKCAASLQPYRPRPETCAALARRLVTGALGVRLKTAAAERENEKRVLREAKERKLLAAKQRDDVWES